MIPQKVSIVNSYFIKKRFEFKFIFQHFFFVFYFDLNLLESYAIPVIMPAASSRIKLKNFLLGFLNEAPIIPQIVVPNVPKNSPIKVIFIKESKLKTS